MRTQQLLERLTAIGESLAHRPGSLALLGLGSVGVELNRLDQYSDLDFFVLVEPGFKEQYLYDLSWLQVVAPLAFSYQNTPDGHKVLFADQIFAEFAVFVPEELSAIPYAEGRIVWQLPGKNLDYVRYPVRSAEKSAIPSHDWVIGEILSALYVGLSRHCRGELLAGYRLVQQDAVRRLLEWISLTEPASGIAPDLFAWERRYEARFPDYAPYLAQWLPGYAETPQAALAILAFLRERAALNPAMQAAIERLASSGA